VVDQLDSARNRPAPTRARTWGRAAAAAAATALAIGLLASGCAKSDTGTAADASTGTIARTDQCVVENAEKPVSGGKIVYGLRAETNGWNPGTNQWAASGLEVAHTFFDTLTAFDDQQQIHPFLLESYTPSADFRQWTFRLRPNITFSNGKPVTAAAIARDLNYLKRSPVTSGAFFYVTKIEATDELSLSITTDTAFTNLPMVFATQIGVAADPDWLETNDSLHPIGTGPFTLDTWKIGDKLEVKKNPHYWQKDKDGTPYPYLDSIEFRVFVDEASRAAALKAKDIDVMEAYSGDDIEQFQQLDGYQILSNPQGESAETFIQLNTMKAPFDDPDARTAVAYATNRESVTDTMTGGFSEVADGPFATSSPWYTPTGYPDYDVAKAKALVEKVKAKHGGEFTVDLLGGGDSDTIKLEQLIQSEWSAAGITVNLQTIEQATLIIDVVTGGYEAVSWQQFDAPNPTLDGVWWSPELAVAPPAFSLNFARNNDQQIGDALTAARSTTDPAKQKEQLAIVTRRLAVDVPYVWLYHRTVSIIASKQLVNLKNYTLPDGAKGLDLNQGEHPLYQVWLDN